MSATTAGNLAIELRKLADAMEANPEAAIEKPYISFYCYSKQHFASAVKLLPRPLKKRVTDQQDPKWARVRVEYFSDGLDIDVSIDQHLTCELIAPAKPAVYRCDPILSLDEIDEVAR